MRVVVVIPPAALVDLATAKAHLRVTDASEDALITAYVAAASAHIDGPAGWLGRAIGEQTLEARGSFFDGDRWALPCPPAVLIASVKYLDQAGAEQTLATSQYEQLGDTVVRAYGASWPSARYGDESVRVRYQAGYSTVPAPIVAAVLLMVGDLYANRETSVMGQAAPIPMSTTVEALLHPFRVFA